MIFYRNRFFSVYNSVNEKYLIGLIKLSLATFNVNIYFVFDEFQYYNGNSISVPIIFVQRHF